MINNTWWDVYDHNDLRMGSIEAETKQDAWDKALKIFGNRADSLKPSNLSKEV